MELKKNKEFFSWEETDKYVSYAQDHNQKTLATIWPHANWEKNLVKEEKQTAHLEENLQNI